MELRVQCLKRRTSFVFSKRRILYRHYLMDGSLQTIVSKIIYLSLPCLGSKGWHSGESTRFPPMWNGIKSRRPHHMWVEFVVDSLLCSKRFFSGYSSGFPLSSKTNISKFQFHQKSGRRRTTLRMCYL